ncbi:S41 family peptidase [Flavitalea flava]
MTISNISIRHRISRHRITCLTLMITMLIFLSGCEKALDLKKAPHDPQAILRECWTVMDQQYALFSVKEADWNAVYREYETKTDKGMTDNDLFRVLNDMLNTLKDGHVTLLSATDTATYEGFYKDYPANFNYNNLLTTYLQNDYRSTGPVIYKIVSNIGYIYYHSFEDPITPGQVDSILAQMSGTKGLIIDVRNNSGGGSPNVDRLFSRFLVTEKLVKYELIKKGPGHDSFFDPQPYSVAPSGIPYKNPVVVLTNRACFSACNDFVLYMSGLSNVKIMGDQTGGGGSFPHNYLMANGWKLQYSATKTLSPSGLSIENGIQPAIQTGISPQDEINGRDPILEKAFQSLQ